MYNIIIWGTGKGYNQYFNLIKYFELIGEIVIQGIVSNDIEIRNTLDGYRYYKKTQIKDLNYDYCLVTIKDMKSIYEEAAQLGIASQKLIPARVLEIPYFDFKKYVYLKEKGLSILSRNCWGGLCYHYLGLEFQSPTINMFFLPREFNRFIGNLEYYLSLPVKFDKMEYERNLDREYPVGRIDDILLYFNHYTDFGEAVSAWERRKRRICRNIVIVSSTTERQEAIEFAKLPFKNKLMFVPNEFNFGQAPFFSVNYHDNDVETIGMYSNRVANGGLSMIDILSFLCQKKFNRIE